MNVRPVVGSAAVPQDQHPRRSSTRRDAVPGATAVAISGAARASGVPITTLRVWQRRYGLGPTRVTEGGHRRYTETDIESLRLARKLIGQGVPTAEAVTAAMRTAHTARRFPISPTASLAAQQLADLAVQLDGPSVSALVDREMATLGPLRCWELVLQPVLSVFGEDDLEPSLSIAAEHLLSHVVTAAAEAVPVSGADRGRGRAPAFLPVLVAAPGEEHILPLSILAAVLASAGIPCIRTRAPLDETALTESDKNVEKLLVLFALLDASRSSVSIPAGCPYPVLWAGPGWPPCPGEPPARAEEPWVNSMREAAELITSSCRSTSDDHRDKRRRDSD